MYFDKIYRLQTGVSFKVSTLALQELIASAINGQKFSELESIRSTTDLHDYLSVIVCDGAEGLIIRRQRWLDQKIKSALTAGHPVSFHSFCNLFWRNLDEDDPDGDEWHQLMASDQFYLQLTILLNKLRIVERSLLQRKEMIPDLFLGST
ncbi:hypothetical protein [Nitrosomonas sp.]|uniref:hypothetical protein n=1 Tax=Nitrosomonas sp. TaxID=42353 RepID=UPI0025D8CC35|nr:hypothetical protein [Nitrosomonas sp.]